MRLGLEVLVLEVRVLEVAALEMLVLGMGVLGMVVLAMTVLRTRARAVGALRDRIRVRVEPDVQGPPTDRTRGAVRGRAGAGRDRPRLLEAGPCVNRGRAMAGRPAEASRHAGSPGHGLTREPRIAVVHEAPRAMIARLERVGAMRSR